MIKMSQEIQEVVDTSNPDAIRQWMIAVKQCIDELSRKALSSQQEIRASAPSASELEENEVVRATVGGLNYIYIKMNGTVLRTQIT